jgi:energy-coupling factor transporter ATP-binding protein EcfA2
MGASRCAECLTNTRAEVLKFIIDWVNDSASEENILWVHGPAGCGKSTLSTTIANMLGDSGQLGVFLFFDCDIIERSDPTTVVRTLAHQLGVSQPRIGAAIHVVIEKNQNMLISPLHHQFWRLLINPLSEVEINTPTIIIVLDALDECGTPDEREALLDVLTHGFTNLPATIHTVIMSRADIDIQNAFESQHHILVYELDIRSPGNSDDILSYFRHCMKLVCTKNRHLWLGVDWPGEEVLHQLVQRASGLFMWAFTASEFINRHALKKRLDIVLSGDVASGAEAALDALYKTALTSAGHWDDKDFVDDFRAILGTILVVRQPLSCAAIDALLHLPDDTPSMHTLSLIGCLLQQNPTV